MHRRRERPDDRVLRPERAAAALHHEGRRGRLVPDVRRGRQQPLRRERARGAPGDGAHGRSEGRQRNRRRRGRLRRRRHGGAVACGGWRRAP